VSDPIRLESACQLAPAVAYDLISNRILSSKFLPLNLITFRILVTSATPDSNKQQRYVTLHQSAGNSFCDTFEPMKTSLLLFSFLIGFFAGLRSLTPPAVTAWAAHLGWLNLQRPFSWIGSSASVVILSLLALAELIADKLPKTPSRTAPPGLIARIVTGGFTGACLAVASGGGTTMGVVLGIIGALAGTFAGYKARTGIVKALRIPDIYVALTEDLIAIGGSFFLVSRL